MSKKKALLHVCCGVCAFGCVERLKEEGYIVEGYFFNPNIYPYTEYRQRKDAAAKVFEIMDVPFYDNHYPISVLLSGSSFFPKIYAKLRDYLPPMCCTQTVTAHPCMPPGNSLASFGNVYCVRLPFTQITCHECPSKPSVSLFTYFGQELSRYRINQKLLQVCKDVKTLKLKLENSDEWFVRSIGTFLYWRKVFP